MMVEKFIFFSIEGFWGFGVLGFWGRIRARSRVRGRVSRDLDAAVAGCVGRRFKRDTFNSGRG